MTNNEDRLSNWLAGNFGEPARRRGAFFERPAGTPDSSSWKWPRSESEELQEAVEAAESSNRAWARMDPDERFERLVRAAAELERRPDPLGTLGPKLSLSRDELSTMARRVRIRFESAEDEKPEARGSAFLRLDAREFLGGFSALLEMMACGRSVVALSDPRCPELGHTFATALDRSRALEGLDGVASLLHDDRRSVMREALGLSDLSALEFHGDDEEWAIVRDEDPGAGPRREHVRVALSTVVVREGDDPDRVAQRIVRRAFGRVEALSGFAAGRVGRVLCHEKRFSALTTAVLEALSDGLHEPGFGSPSDLTALEPELPRILAGLRTLALDEGATVLIGGGAPPGRSRGSQRGLGRAILAPATTPWATVVTNVEERMRTARPARPAPLLCLLRARSDRAAEEAARRLDQPVTD